jgi:hypothetical protein
MCLNVHRQYDIIKYSNVCNKDKSNEVISNTHIDTPISICDQIQSHFHITFQYL